ncbi:NAD(P)-dependent alcohol dehydrogenase [Rhodococcus sp. UNC363MFTsu5.1]|uniref:NAD(P)-dependent alcohol dehydrogenase n=1 Tax=Rhodococcus sp. UNC363MFTsu5.1 TaxID=1449069 RepID=UPI000A7AEC0C|nr:NAD(P)-dependent alcohol dehydrogenase [Rhodococcus sp. UNC363MFTsu5.1]
MGDRVRAAVLAEYGGPTQIREIRTGALREREILVRMAGVGICHTDLTAAAGAIPFPLPAVLGHEGSGVVESVGSCVDTVRAGDHVVLSFASCQQCPNCTGGHPAYCTDFAALNYSGRRRDGSTTLHSGSGEVHGGWFGQSSFATHAVVDAAGAVKVAADLPLALLGPLGCGIQTGAGAVLRVLRPRPGSSVIVFGAGAVGLGSVLAAAATGCATILVVDPLPARRELAVKLGATAALDSATPGLGRELRRLTGGGADHSVDTVSSEEVLNLAVSTLRSPGSCATLGLRGQRNPVLIDQSSLLMGRSVTGVIEGDVDPQTFIPELIELWRAGRFPFEEMITTFPFEEIEAALAAASSGAVVKPVLTF